METKYYTCNECGMPTPCMFRVTVGYGIDVTDCPDFGINDGANWVESTDEKEILEQIKTDAENCLKRLDDVLEES